MTQALGGRLDERELLTGFLDWYRAVAERKIQGLSSEDASRVMTPSGLSPLGIVKHLGFVERAWFQLRFAGQDVEVPYVDGDNAVQFRVEQDTVDSVLAFYERECEHARRVTDGASLDDVSRTQSPIYGTVTLRWILVHMIEETARHAGHLDIMREHIDGTTDA